ncbi:hypothetical protein NIES2135_05900 [Leptolyngbya boryana NIES-2135]|jgi:hypothetical protein|uniref:Uncharacterized protein n=1 Tax=Leptolyngbya boryana NIES-2135 TaxID=1973484 RepID=A0A1Z4JAH4_LEPBY|nr:hypothetical protein NIES2135_05900 [Leptolyngbya boryana NIES-2135]
MHGLIEEIHPKIMDEQFEFFDQAILNQIQVH